MFVFRRALQTIVDKEVGLRQESLKTRLASISSLAITMDIWSDAKMRGYLGVTAHYVHEHEISSTCLAVSRFHGMYAALSKDVFLNVLVHLISH